jgi:NAD+ diphosphatase
VSEWTPRDEPSTRTAFSGGTLNRSMEKRDDTSLALAMDHVAARWLVFAQGKLLLETGSNHVRTLLDVLEIDALDVERQEAVLLGHDGAGPVLAVPSKLPFENITGRFAAHDVRSVYREGLLDRETLSAVAQASSLLSWHQTHKFCGRCGGRNEPKSAGAKRICTTCAAEHFPRTDPVVIMLTVRGDFCLLARGPHFPEKMVSCLAGFLEPGETIEEAVRRETLEEAGIRTGKVSYHASQPWPFAHSLMIGCFAEAIDAEIRLDPDELAEGRWFSRSEVREMLDGTHTEGWILPPPGAIATLLIRDWAEA